MSIGVSKDTQSKLRDYIDKRSSMLGYYEEEMLEKAVWNCNRKMYQHLFTDLTGPNVTDEQIHKKADELVETIVLEDIREKLTKCDRQRVREFLHVWMDEWTDPPQELNETPKR